MVLKYVGIRVTNLERSVAFYSELLGLKEVHRGDMSQYGGGRGRFVLLQDPESGQRLELNRYPEGSPWAPPYVPGEGLDHIGFEVEDAVAVYQELIAKGARPAGIDPSMTMGWSGYVLDPDGNWIEIYKRT